MYCYLAGIEGTEYPDLKIRNCLDEEKIKELIAGREYFSTGNHAINRPMINILNSLYPEKSKYEI